VFLLGTVVNEFMFAAVRPTLHRAIAFLAFSLLLAFGVGLLGGGIQHFEQFPERSAAMTPLGLLMSYAAFVAKDPEGRWRNLFSTFGAGIVIVVTWSGMNAIAETLESTGHSHDTEEIPANRSPADTKVPSDHESETHDHRAHSAGHSHPAPMFIPGRL
jgi:hypothetical protein